MKASNSKIYNLLGLNCGIYKITNLITKKCYIGSSTNIAKRLHGHKADLNLNKHHSIKLQRSYNMHGIEAFVFEILEICLSEDLEKTEKIWIDFFNSYHDGYNSTDEVGAAWRGKKVPIYIKKLQKCREVKIISPEGEVVEWYSIKDFCDNHGLHTGAIADILDGKSYQHKGWRKFHEDLINVKFDRQAYYKKLGGNRKSCVEYSFVNPNGEIYKGKNIQVLADKYQLHSSALLRVLHGTANHHKGWRLATTKTIGVIFNQKRAYINHVKQ